MIKQENQCLSTDSMNQHPNFSLSSNSQHPYSHLPETIFLRFILELFCLLNKSNIFSPPGCCSRSFLICKQVSRSMESLLFSFHSLFSENACFGNQSAVIVRHSSLRNPYPILISHNRYTNTCSWWCYFKGQLARLMLQEGERINVSF